MPIELDVGRKRAMDSNAIAILGIVITSVIAVAAILVSVLLYLKQKSRKELSYEIVSSASVVSVASNVSSKLQILFEGKPVTRTVHLLVIRLTNTGNQPVKREDYYTPIEFQFNASAARILDAEIMESQPPGASLDKDPTLLADGKVRLLPGLLNEKEQVQLSILLEGEDASPEVSARIIGGNMKPFKARRFRSIKEQRMAVLVIAMAVIAIFILFPLFLVTADQLFGLVGLSLLSITVGISGTFVYMNSFMNS